MKIRPAKLNDLDEIHQLFQFITQWLQNQGNFQWNLDYPSKKVLKQDIKNNALFVNVQNDEIVACITIDTFQPKNYAQIPWSISGKPICIHRLAVLPKFQGQNIGYKMCLFAEQLALEKGFDVIRLDSYAQNHAAHHLYQKKLGYHLLKDHPINVNGTAFCQCFEKEICPENDSF